MGWHMFHRKEVMFLIGHVEVEMLVGISVERYQIQNMWKKTPNPT